MRQPAVYIMANFRNGTLYVGATSDLVRRTYLLREELLDGFTKKYGCKKLVYYEQHTTMPLALEREEQIKSGSRKKKLALIDGINPNWSDLYLEIIWMATPCGLAKANIEDIRKKCQAKLKANWKVKQRGDVDSRNSYSPHKIELELRSELQI